MANWSDFEKTLLFRRNLCASFTIFIVSSEQGTIIQIYINSQPCSVQAVNKKSSDLQKKNTEITPLKTNGGNLKIPPWLEGETSEPTPPNFGVPAFS